MLNTAVFFDLENLIGGYSASANGAIAGLSLSGILDEIRQLPEVGGFSVLRAYANWSNPKLGLLRREIVGLGIDPVQVFGFDQEQKKNAADIQLAIDATELSIIRHAITTFVIVSGDSGFGALARRLHEHGRYVIGAAKKSSSNKALRGVCDAFIHLADGDGPNDLTSFAPNRPKTGSQSRTKPTAVTAGQPKIGSKRSSKTFRTNQWILVF